MIYETLQKTGLPVAYSHFKKEQTFPYLVYIGSGQEQFKADNEIYEKENTYQVEFYYKQKNEVVEGSIEAVLEADNYFYEKSEDSYLDDQDCFLIYYDVYKKGYYHGS